MTLDVLSPKGQVSVKDEALAVALFTNKFKGYQYVETPKSGPADVDALLMLDKQLRQVIETKCRYDCDINKFMHVYQGEWLVTEEKILKARNIAKQLGIGVTGFLFIVPSKTLLVQQIADADGRLLVNIRTQSTETKATINGGRVIRNNSYIDMRKAMVIQ